MTTTKSPVDTPTAGATLIPGTSPEEIRRAFEEAWGVDAPIPGQDMEEYSQKTSEVLNSGVMCDAPRPPAGAESRLRSIDIGDLTVFYHSTCPVEEKYRYQWFTWNFYIGRIGEGPESIMVDWAEKGIVVKTQGLTGQWENLRFLTVEACTRVRLSYPDRAHGDDGILITHELVFPPNPHEASIPVHYLQ